MTTVQSVKEMKALVRDWRAAGRTIGFVPTMGFLHEGHLSLVRASRSRCGVTVVSVFVNPAQFGPREDFQRYPRDLERDAALLEAEGVDVLFAPLAQDIYPPGYRTWVEVHGLQDRLCGASRPGHFRGVATVVLKLFNIVRPDAAFFGAKDAQQALLIRRMAADLDLDIDIVTCPIVREADGLAMSSRNSYLSPDERKAALALSRGLRWAEGEVAAGERDAKRLEAGVRARLAEEPLVRVDYVEVVDPESLEPVDVLQGPALLAVAAYVGSTRLIDNAILRT